MTADFGNFNEAFEQLRDAFGTEEPPGGRKTPVWVKYVDVKAGDRIDTIIRTGLQMHAAVTGKTYNNAGFVHKKIPVNFIKAILEDIESKAKVIYLDYDNRFLINDTSLIEFKCNLEIDEDFALYLYTLDPEFETYIKNTIAFHIDDMKGMDDSLA